jgi:uncharacterized protein involved in outer membrane biogenesis
MKKWIVRSLLALLLLLVAALVVTVLCLGSIVKKGVESIGPTATKAGVTLKSAHVSPITFLLNLEGLVIGNPSGYKTLTAIEVDDLSVRVNPATVFSSKLVVDSISLKAPVITLEGGLKNNNLKTLEKNLDDYMAAGSPQPNAAPASSTSAAPPAKSERKLQVNELTITGAKLHLDMKISGGREVTLSIPTIHLTQLGAGPEGITAAGVAQRTLQAILESATSQISNQLAGIGKQGGQQVQDAAKKASSSLKSFFSH